ncbi:MAG TPA: hypothetical protein VFF54_05150 [Thermodesulfobacteriota bacterium]|nr:hypothetical protein [Thermodesulfobacteriota bacterium]
MKKKMVLLGAFFVFAVSMQSFAYSADSPASSWLKSMAYKIKVISKAEKPQATAVVGVKGAEQTTKEDELYWKESATKDEEIKRFTEAYDAAEKGNKDEALAKLEAFVKDYPDSPLVKDARAGIDALKAEGK